MVVPAVHLISDRRLVPDLVETTRAALAGLSPRSVAVHLREKDLRGRALLDLARALRGVCAESGQLLLVNDRIDVALVAGVDGVHLPSAGVPVGEARRLLGSEKLVGCSCHSREDVERALEGGADYATFGPVFDTPSKRQYGSPVGLRTLEEASRLGLPLMALGGIDLVTAGAALEAGARGVAVIRAWLGEPDAARAVGELVALARLARSTRLL